MFGHSIDSLLLLAGQQPLLQAAAIILGTFVLEDAATILAAMQAGAGKVSVAVALGSLYVGIVLGDLGLYGMGRLARRLPWVERWLPPRRSETIRAWMEGRLFRLVLISRFVPGSRLPTYTTCGLVGADLRQFAGAAVVATLCWTTLLFAASMRVGHLLVQYLGAYRWAGAIGFTVFVIIACRLAASGLQAERP